MAKSIMLQGTGSSVGKSIITAGLCRVMSQDGYTVAPFKSQNMALNSFITDNGKEMGRAQVVQAEAANQLPDVRMNPILLKPTHDQMAQVILMGDVYQNMSAVEYHNFKPTLKDKITEVYLSLADENDFIVLEGAGSPAEINLNDKDIVNMGMAEISDSPVIIIGDIDKGGVFASLYGTYELLTKAEQARVVGFIINKFRGDIALLKPGLQQIEDLTGIPVLGVVPYADLKIEDEDSVSNRFYKTSQTGDINIEVIYLPHVSNFTDLNIFETFDDVNLRYVMRGESLNNPDLIVIPGSKNTIEDLIYLKNSGLEKQIIEMNRKGSYVMGICGGYQMLGKTLRDPHHTETTIEEMNGIGLLDVTTTFELEKTTTQVEGKVLDTFNNLSDHQVKGYEIHMGKTILGDEISPFIQVNKKLGETADFYDGAVNRDKTVFGTYIHGIFDEVDFSRAFINMIRERKGLNSVDEKAIDSFEAFKDNEYNKLAQLLRDSLDIKRIYKLIRGF